jgi:hypothetical protein
VAVVTTDGRDYSRSGFAPTTCFGEFLQTPKRSTQMAESIVPRPEHKEFLFYYGRSNKSDQELIDYCNTEVRDWLLEDTPISSADFWTLKLGDTFILAVGLNQGGTDWSRINRIDEFFEVDAQGNSLVVQSRLDLAFRRSGGASVGVPSAKHAN